MIERLNIVALGLLLFQQAHAGTPTKVRIDFLEGLSPKDTTSSERFQREFEGTIQLGQTLLAAKLSKCGYTLETKSSFYEASDALRAKELAAKSESEGSWLLVGPRRSNHYLLMVQGVQNTPSVSLMASADEVARLGKQHTSLSPSNTQMAEIAVREAKAAKGRHATYTTVLSDDCTNCVDFSRAFDQAASQAGLRKLGEIKITGETFDLKPIQKTVTDQKPDFVLLPNYSKVANSVMGAFNELKRPPLFIGGDGWGDNRYGFVQNGHRIENIRGLTVRGFPSVDQGLSSFQLGRAALKEPRQYAFSAPSVGILKILDVTADLLCSARPQSKAEFLKLFEKLPNQRLHAPWGVSVYTLTSGEISFQATRKTRR